MAFVDEQTAPFLLIQRRNDFDVAFEHAWRTVEALHEASMEAMARALPEPGHRRIGGWLVIGPQTLAFLGRHLRKDA